MPVERREQVIAVAIGSTGNGMSPICNGRRQPSCAGTSRMMREYQVRICERLRVQFPGPTRQANVRPTMSDRTSIGFRNDIRYVVTSLQNSDAAHVYETDYCARGQAENLIKQHKAQLSSDRT